ncbi:hypothetical protein L1987_22728 [Smallanthus sonchifolius]|uniref:Uncharacterized protein n=1 Tax=Smallanthus sonchifolius TaxID=185202 RepID=A0ACB9IEX9_9ASTR|nr:hypothetical protein L1987_22728 [Smallanthus sonchifolius]
MEAASRRFTDNPSFSSTLLDEIYRSIDDQSTETKFKSRNDCFEDDDCLMRKWTENKKPLVGRRSAMRYERELFCLNSCSSSCDSCCGGGVSSSETESVYGVLIKPKPIRTSVYQYQRDEIIKPEKQRIVYGEETKSKHEGKFVKTKSKALKIYSDLKKVKQPISPGGRLAAFLNSLFTTGNNKKRNNSSAVTDGGYTEAVRSHLDRKSKSANASTCSSASSFSRSCLSNTPLSREKFSNGVKRSVRFFPVDEDCQLHEEETNLNSIKFAQISINKEVKLNLSDKNRHISEAARNLLKNYQKKVECEFNSKTNHEYEDQFDDDRSDSSSDLFELDNIGMHKYREELPVYETTQLDTNRLLM